MAITVTKNLVIKDCNEKFAEMIHSLHEAYSRNIKFHFDADFSGKQEDFKYYYSKIDAEELFKIVKRVSEKTTNEQEYQS